MLFKTAEPLIEGVPVLLSPAVANADRQQGELSSVIGLAQILNGPERQLRHAAFQGGHLSRQVVGGPFRCHDQGMATLGQNVSRLLQRRSVEASAMDGDPPASLQQPADHRSRPQWNTPVVEIAEFYRSRQRQPKSLRCPGNPIPEQVGQHQRIARAGMSEGQQQAGVSPLLGTEGLGELFRCNSRPDLQVLQTQGKRNQPTQDLLHQAGRLCRQSSECGAGRKN